MHKRRETPRLRFDVVVEDRKTMQKGITRNISIEGCFLEKEGAFQELLPVGSTIDLVLYLPNTDKHIRTKGVVKHHGTHEDGMGIFFKDLNKQASTIIQEFINGFLDDLSFCLDQCFHVRGQGAVVVRRHVSIVASIIQAVNQ